MMTWPLFFVFIAVVVCGGFLSSFVCRFRFLLNWLAPPDTIATPTVAPIALIFGLFLAFGTSEITMRSRELDLAVRKEVSVLRSIFKFAEAVGPSADPVRESLIEYLQAVTTLEQGWLQNPLGSDEDPAQPNADAMIQVATLFVVQ